jgi:hypothetical protein
MLSKLPSVVYGNVSAKKIHKMAIKTGRIVHGDFIDTIIFQC